MFSSLKGKKLLLLGGVKRACAIVERAQKLGIYVIVADYYEDSPAKKVADEAALIDATDVEALVAFCKERGVDGVMTAYVDVLLPACMEVSRRIGRPFYADEQMIRLATDKTAFKQTCMQHGVPVPKTFDVHNDTFKEDAKTLPYPVFVKPVDASGSRGAAVCFSEADFCEKYEAALAFSKRKEITVEQYLTGTEFILDYLLIDSEPYLLSMFDRFFAKGRELAFNHSELMLAPSANLAAYAKTVDPAVRAMFRSLGWKNGVVFLQGYAKDGQATFYEMGCRLGGTYPYIDEAFTGFNPVDLLLSHALTGRMVPEGTDVSSITPFFDGLSAVLYFVATKGEGRIAKVTGLDELSSMPDVVWYLPYYREGDAFSLGRLTDVLFLAVHVVAKNYDALDRAMKKIYATVDYLDENGNSLLPNKVTLDEATKTVPLSIK